MNRQERRAGLAFARKSKDEWHPFERVSPAEVGAFRVAEYASRQGDLVSLHRNNVYSVQVFARTVANHGDEPFGDRQCIQLAIRRHDGREVQGWDDLQRIKNEIAGRDAYAIEIYPPEDNVVNAANMRHLFCYAEGDEPADLPALDIRGRWA